MDGGSGTIELVTCARCEHEVDPDHAYCPLCGAQQVVDSDLRGTRAESGAQRSPRSLAIGFACFSTLAVALTVVCTLLLTSFLHIPTPRSKFVFAEGNYDKACDAYYQTCDITAVFVNKGTVGVGEITFTVTDLDDTKLAECTATLHSAKKNSIEAAQCTASSTELYSYLYDHSATDVKISHSVENFAS